MALAQGTYQFGYRLINKDTNKYTKYSLLTNPVSVYNKISNNVGVGGIGNSGDFKIKFEIHFTQKERSFYNYYQVIVIKNIVGSPSTDTSVYQLAPREITSAYNTYIYNGNSEETSIDISDVNLVTQPVKSVKTITSKLNRIVGGNVRYKKLDYDNGEPTVGVQTNVKKKSIGRGYLSTEHNDGIGYNDPNNASKYTGYFRGELYRFAVSYFDEFGNFSEPRVLNLSSAANNKASSGVDFKFPSRKDFGYSILDSTDSVQALGLDIKGLKNHPTWAKGFVIVRVNRDKNIIGQTPVIPSSIIEMPDAENNYPSEVEDDGSFTGNPLGTLTPKNFEYGIVKNIVRDSNGRVVYAMKKDDSKPQIEASRHIVFCYIPEKIYNNNEETLPSGDISKNDSLEIVDALILDKRRVSFTEGKDVSLEEGNYIDTSVGTTYYALKDENHYYESTNANRDLLSSISGIQDSIKIRESKNIQNNQEFQALSSFAKNLKTSTVGDYEGIKDSLGIGYTPSNLKSTVLVLNDEYIDPAYKFLDQAISGDPDSLANGDVNKQFTKGNLITNSGTFPNTGTLDEDGIQINDYSDADSSVNPKGVITVANITKGLGDDRYGDVTESKRFISTGAIHYFSENEISLNEQKLSNPIDIEVWGGDCFISVFNIKITDKTYSLMLPVFDGVPQGLSETELSWGKGSFRATDDLVNMPRPVAIRNNSQVITLYLESEVNGDAVVREVYGSTLSDIGVATSSEKEAGSPVDYQYNLSFSLQNSLKNFEIRNSITEDINDYRSRIIYSDTKVYQSDIEGFDIFRALNFSDIDETYGEITKLAKAGDDLFSIQKRGISYIPVSSRIIETSDLDTLSVRSGEYLGEPYYLSNTQGTSLLESVRQTKSAIYLIDDYNKEVLSISNRSIKNISELGLHSFIKTLDLSSGKTYSVFNESEDEYSFYNNNIQKGAVFSERMGKWISTLELSSNDFLGPMVYDNEKIYTIGYGVTENTDNVNIYKLYSGDFTKFLENPYESSIKFVVNKDEGVTKVYDNTIINAKGNLKSIKYSSRDTYTNDLNLDINNKEDLYRIKVLRGQNGERIRGVFSDVLIKFKDSLSSIYSVSTKIRPSYRFKR